MTEAAAAERARYAALRNPPFRRYWAGQWVSQTGSWMQNVAQIVLVLRLGGTGLAVGLVGLCQTLPTLLLGLWAGAVVDRTDRMRLLVPLQSIQLVLALGLGVLTLTDHVGMPAVFVVALLAGTCSAFDNTARRSVLADFLPTSELANVMSLQSAALTGARVTGPLFAGLVVEHANVGWCFVLNAASFAVMLVALLDLSKHLTPVPKKSSREPGQVRAGLREVWGHGELRALFLLLFVLSTLSFNWGVLFPLLMKALRGSDSAYTLLITAYSVGSVGGSLWLAGRPAGRARHLAAAGVMYGLTLLALAAAPNRFVAVALAVPNGAVGIVFLAGVMASVQTFGSSAMLGRLMALYYVVLIGSSAIGAPVTGWVADQLGARTTTALSGGCAVAIGAGALVALTASARARVSSAQR